MEAINPLCESVGVKDTTNAGSVGSMAEKKSTAGVAMPRIATTVLAVTESTTVDRCLGRESIKNLLILSRAVNCYRTRRY